MTPARKWLSTGSLPLAIALLVAAVGATLLAVRLGDGTASVLEDWTAAARREGTYRFSTRQEIGGDRAARSIGSFLNMDGAVDLASGLSRSVSTLKVLGVNAKCTYIGKGADAIYVNVHPTRRAQLGATWLRGDLASLSGAFPFRLDQIDDDPSKFVKDLEEDGSGVVRGVDTTRYRGTFDLSSNVPQTSAQPLASALTRGIPVSLYIDDEGLLRRMAILLSQSSAMQVRMTMDLYDYGKPVKIAEPPARSTKPGRPDQIATACFPASLGRPPA